MTRLHLRYVPFSNSIEPLYEIYDASGETYGEPRPYDIALKDMRFRQATIDAQALEDLAVAHMMIG